MVVTHTGHTGAAGASTGDAAEREDETVGEERGRMSGRGEGDGVEDEGEESMWENVYQFSTFKAIVAEEFGGEACVGGTQWPGGVRIARYLDNRAIFADGALAGKRVVDLGAGCGLVSVVAAKLGARVVSTDKDIVMDVLIDNLSRNGVLHTPQERDEEERYPAGKAVVEELWWGPDVAHREAPFDIVIAAACLYLPRTVPLLLQTLHRLSSPDSLILMTTLIGKDTFARYCEEVGKWFHVEGRGDDGELLGYFCRDEREEEEAVAKGARNLQDLELATNVLVLRRKELGEGVTYGDGRSASTEQQEKEQEAWC